MTTEEDEHKNFIEAKIIIQECHNDPSVFVVGTAPFGKLWFDHEKIEQQYKILTDSWFEEYGDNETQHSKRPRIVSVLLDEKDPMFNKYRENIREAQEKKLVNEESECNNCNVNENVVIENDNSLLSSSDNNDSSQDDIDTDKKHTKSKKKTIKKPVSPSQESDGNENKPKRGRPKKKQTDIKDAFSKVSS